MTDRLQHLPLRPAGTEPVYSMNRLRRGDLIHYDGALWNILSVARTDREDVDWIVALRPHGETLDWAALDGDIHLGFRGFVTVHRYVDPEHYPVCAVCSGPWPCRQLHIEREAGKSLDRADRYATPNVCPACQEPVTTRQLRQTWPVNLYALDRAQPVTFHLRRKCIEEATAYDHAVLKAGHASQLGHEKPRQ